jgi:hypothetical protein
MQQRNGVLCAVRVEMFVTVRYLPYVYDYITILCRQQAEVIQIIRMNMFAV